MKTPALLALILLVGCASTKNGGNTDMKNDAEFTPQFIPGPPVVVYKTTKNYNNNVPVLLTDDKSAVASYPHPKDVMTGGGYALPAVLHDGYLLDNRGIGKNVAFLKWTYEEYAKLQSVPSLQELYGSIIDKDPLVELCDCGNKQAFRDVTEQLNRLIDSKMLRTTCRAVK